MIYAATPSSSLSSSPAIMSIISSIPPPKKWNHKQIILVTLIGCLVVNAITAAISITLSPAHIFFSIRDAKTSGNKNGEEDTMLYTFTLQVKNTSPRMAVHYGALSAQVWYRATTWVPAEVNQSTLQDDGTTQPPGIAVANISMSAEYWQSEQQSMTPATGSGGKDNKTPPPPPSDDVDDNNTDWSNCTVLVTASVWFKSPWWIRTRAYGVTANCSQVNFDNDTAIVDCK